MPIWPGESRCKCAQGDTSRTEPLRAQVPQSVPQSAGRPTWMDWTSSPLKGGLKGLGRSSHPSQDNSPGGQASLQTPHTSLHEGGVS